jgi:hypothetical protein
MEVQTMFKFSCATLLFLALCGLLLTHSPVTIPVVAQSQACVLVGQLSANGTSTTLDNTQSGTQCNTWSLVAYTTGSVTAYSIELDGAGPALSYSAVTPVSGYSNPCTTLTGCLILAQVNYSYFQVKVSGYMGSGPIYYRLQGAAGISAKILGGGSSGTQAVPTTYQIQTCGAQVACTVTMAQNVVSNHYLLYLTTTNSAACTVQDSAGDSFTSLTSGNVSGNFSEMLFTQLGTSGALTVSCSNSGAVTFQNATAMEFSGPPGFTGTKDLGAAITGCVDYAMCGKAITTARNNEVVFFGMGFDHQYSWAVPYLPLFNASLNSVWEGTQLSTAIIPTASNYYLGNYIFIGSTMGDAVGLIGSLY